MHTLQSRMTSFLGVLVIALVVVLLLSCLRSSGVDRTVVERPVVPCGDLMEQEKTTIAIFKQRSRTIR